MRGINIATASAALFTTSAIAGHKAVVQNLCEGDVYLWPVDASNAIDGAVARNSQMPHKISPGSSYREVMRELVTGGVSLKLSQANDLYGAITQFEYTWDGMTWYDISNVNCDGPECPFAEAGMFLESAPGCPTVTCFPGNDTCHQAYNNPHDDWASLCCLEGQPDVTLFLCSDSTPSTQPPLPEPYKPYVPKKKQHKPSLENAQVAAADVTTPKPKHHRPRPTPVDPATEIVEVTQVSTVVVTVTPEANSKHNHARHVHQHAHAHAH